MHRNLADIATARALRHALDTGSRFDVVVGELVELARDDQRALEVALARVNRGLADRWSLVGERARDVLEQALDQVAASAGFARAPAALHSVGRLASPRSGPKAGNSTSGTIRDTT